MLRFHSDSRFVGTEVVRTVYFAWSVMSPLRCVLFWWDGWAEGELLLRPIKPWHQRRGLIPHFLVKLRSVSMETLGMSPALVRDTSSQRVRGQISSFIRQHIDPVDYPPAANSSCTVATDES